MPPYTNISLFLKVSDKNYISYPKILMKSEATVVFDQKISQGSIFKKDSQFISIFSIVMWCCGCAPSQAFLFLWHLHSEFVNIMILNNHYSQRQNSIPPFPYLNKKKKWGICKSRLYSLDVSADIPILDSLLVYVY